MRAVQWFCVFAFVLFTNIVVETSAVNKENEPQPTDLNDNYMINSLLHSLDTPEQNSSTLHDAIKSIGRSHDGNNKKSSTTIKITYRKRTKPEKGSHKNIKSNNDGNHFAGESNSRQHKRIYKMFKSKGGSGSKHNQHSHKSGKHSAENIDHLLIALLKEKAKHNENGEQADGHLSESTEYGSFYEPYEPETGEQTVDEHMHRTLKGTSARTGLEESKELGETELYVTKSSSENKLNNAVYTNVDFETESFVDLSPETTEPTAGNVSDDANDNAQSSLEVKRLLLDHLQNNAQVTRTNEYTSKDIEDASTPHQDSTLTTSTVSEKSDETKHEENTESSATETAKQTIDVSSFKDTEVNEGSNVETLLKNICDAAKDNIKQFWELLIQYVQSNAKDNGNTKSLDTTKDTLEKILLAYISSKGKKHSAETGYDLERSLYGSSSPEGNSKGLVRSRIEDDISKEIYELLKLKEYEGTTPSITLQTAKDSKDIVLPKETATPSQSEENLTIAKILDLQHLLTDVVRHTSPATLPDESVFATEPTIDFNESDFHTEQTNEKKSKDSSEEYLLLSKENKHSHVRSHENLRGRDNDGDSHDLDYTLDYELNNKLLPSPKHDNSHESHHQGNVLIKLLSENVNNNDENKQPHLELTSVENKPESKEDIKKIQHYVKHHKNPFNSLEEKNSNSVEKVMSSAPIKPVSDDSEEKAKVSYELSNESQEADDNVVNKHTPQAQNEKPLTNEIDILNYLINTIITEPNQHKNLKKNSEYALKLMLWLNQLDQPGNKHYSVQSHKNPDTHYLVNLFQNSGLVSEESEPSQKHYRLRLDAKAISALDKILKSTSNPFKKAELEHLLQTVSIEQLGDSVGESNENPNIKPVIKSDHSNNALQQVLLAIQRYDNYNNKPKVTDINRLKLIVDPEVAEAINKILTSKTEKNKKAKIEHILQTGFINSQTLNKSHRNKHVKNYNPRNFDKYTIKQMLKEISNLQGKSLPDRTLDGLVEYLENSVATGSNCESKSYNNVLQKVVQFIKNIPKTSDDSQYIY